MTDKLPFRWFIILFVLALAGLAIWRNWPLNYGIDLAGGNTITYSIDRSVLEEFARTGTDLEEAMNTTIKVISTRIDNLGVKDLSVRREGRDRILVQAPKLAEDEAAEIKRRIVQLGELKFLIGVGEALGNSSPGPLQVPAKAAGATESYTFDQVAADAQRKTALEKGKEAIAKAKAANGPIPRDAYRDGTSYQLRTADDRPLPFFWKPWAPGQAAVRTGIAEADIKRALNAAALGQEYTADHIKGGWLYADPKYFPEGSPDKGFTGKDITSPGRGHDEFGRRTVTYNVIRERQGDFERYTRTYIKKPMAIVLNDEIWSAPSIDSELRDSVQIHGGAGEGFSQAEQDWLLNCLQSGSLRLRPRLESEDKIGAVLGDVAVNRGVYSTIISAILIFVFMLVYYRTSGVVAVITLIMNLFLTVAMMALFRSTLTLPGVAGLVLTIGMAVDANILIFERIREELARGKPLLAACQAGFDRAFITIIDSNLTTIITAVALYKFGVGPIKGFAVTLMAGLFCSLFTAIFVAKTLFGTMLGSGAIKKISMMKLLPDNLHIDFLSKARTWVMTSAALVVGSFLIFFASDDTKYGLDFTGGYVVRMNLVDGATTSEVGNAVSAFRSPEGNQKYPASEPTGLRDSAVEGGRYRTIDIKVQSVARASAQTVSNRIDQDLKAIFGAQLTKVDPAVLDDASGDWRAIFEMTDAQSRDEVGARLANFRDSRSQAPFETALYEHLDGKEQGRQIFAKRWRLSVNEKNLLGHEILDDLKSAFAARMPKTADGSVNEASTFTKLSFVGPSVVSDLKSNAAVAIIVSLIGIILYIWFRFKELKYGIAAAVATFHDAIVAVGACVLFNKLGVVHVPINLPIIAGFLTIMGYSLNDTIVQFDRVRENLGNVRGSFKDIVNLSINQTLARTVLTALTTFCVVMVLFAANMGQESGIEGIAFCLLIGVVVGTYSTIYVASPVLVWLHERGPRKKPAETAAPAKVGKPATN